MSKTFDNGMICVSEQAVVVVDENEFLEALDELVEQAFDDQCTGANPRYPLMSELRELYTRAYYGRNGEEQLTDDAYPEEAAA